MFCKLSKFTFFHAELIKLCQEAWKEEKQVKYFQNFLEELIG